MLCSVSPTRYLKGVLYRVLNSSKFFSTLEKKAGTSFVAENLTNRSIIKVSGEESYNFLQGLITNDIGSLQSEKQSIFTMFLNSKGRVIYDAIIYKSFCKNELWIECDTSGIDSLVKHLNLYRLKRKVVISKALSELNVWVVFNPKFTYSFNQEGIDRGLPNSIFSQLTSDIGNKALICKDPRLSDLGLRVILPENSDFNETLLNKSISMTDEHLPSQYKLYRYKLGVCEGLDEMPYSECFPLEMNCDYMNGVSFTKGCYIGQELTARTYHTGVVRKRLMPIVLDSEPKTPLEYNTPIENPTGKTRFPVGKLRGVLGNIGIGLLRIKEAIGAESLKMGSSYVKTYQPYWWPTELSKKLNA